MEKANQAEARLKYLLSQSDIFSHFGLNAGNKKVVDNTPSSPESPRHRGRAAAADADLDEDELAMLEEENDESTAAPGKGHTVMLQRQPTVITGGTMRAYKLEGLNWLIRLQENGINGILADEMGLGGVLFPLCCMFYIVLRKNTAEHIYFSIHARVQESRRSASHHCAEVHTIQLD